MQYIARIGVYVICSVLLLSGCVTNEKGSSSKQLAESIIGPKFSSFFDPKRMAKIDPDKKKLEVIVPVFDPGLTAEAEKYSEEGIWPELRRAEANRFAYKLKTALEDTNAFGAVRVTPDNTATGDLYVLGKIVESNGEKIEIEIKLVDITGKQWFTKYSERSVEPE
jgi:hypothetical protein